MEKRGFWLSYDLGIAGDYPDLYQWLDDHEAKSCGNSIAFFKYQVDQKELPFRKIKEDLIQKVNLKPENVLYLIGRASIDEKKTIGRFIFGRRKASPWEGYGSKANEHDDE